MNKIASKLSTFAITSVMLIAFAPLAFAGEMYPVGTPVMSMPHTLSVTGEGRVTVAADRAEISLSIDSTDTNARAARLKNNQVVTQLREKLATFGLAKEDVVLNYSSGYPNYEYKEDNTRKQISYNSNYSVTVKVKDLNKLSDIQDAIGDFETVNINSTNYLLDNNENALDQAREKAFKDVQKKAEKLAKAFGVKLGAVSNISEMSYLGIAYGSPYSGQSNTVDVSMSLSATYEFTK